MVGTGKRTTRELSNDYQENGTACGIIGTGKSCPNSHRETRTLIWQSENCCILAVFGIASTTSSQFLADVRT